MSTTRCLSSFRGNDWTGWTRHIRRALGLDMDRGGRLDRRRDLLGTYRPSENQGKLSGSNSENAFRIWQWRLAQLEYFGCDAISAGPAPRLICNLIYYDDLLRWATTVGHLRGQPEWQQLIADIACPDTPVQQPNNLWSPVFWRVAH